MEAAAAATTTTELVHPSGARARVHLYGATVTAFYTADEPTRNVLFVSERAALDGSKPIRGGIPLVFPIFGSAPGFPNHGLVRTSSKWTLTQLTQPPANDPNDPNSNDPVGPTVATFALAADDATRAVWPADFCLTYVVALSARTLVTSLHVRNVSPSDPMAFHALLHTYLGVDDVRDGGVQVVGLQGLRYNDKVTGTSATDDRAALTIASETDSVYIDAPSTLVVRIRGSNGINGSIRSDDGSQQPQHRIVTIEKAAFVGNDPVAGAQPSDAVVWNPWAAKAQAMSDFGDDEYVRMVCVEPGRVSAQQTLAPGCKYTLQQTLTSALVASL